MSDTPTDLGRPFEDLRDEGLLWLINTTVFHPRGYALRIHFENDDPENLGVATGWSLMGDGTEPWQFACDDESQARCDFALKAVKKLMP